MTMTMPRWEVKERGTVPIRETGDGINSIHSERAARIWIVKHDLYSDTIEEKRVYFPVSNRRAQRKSTDAISLFIHSQAFLLSEDDAPTSSSWKMMTDFLHMTALESELLSIKFPYIANADDQSTDLYWKAGNVDLLINFPKNSSSLPTYYGSSKGGSDISGHISTDFSSSVFFEWLSRK
jgi:hypothetical protein